MKNAARTAVGLAGLLVVALLHSLLFAAAMWGDGIQKRLPDRPEAIGTGANSGRPEGESTERRMIVRLIMDLEANRNPTDEPAQLLDEALNSPKVQITGLDTLPLPPLLVQEDGDPVASSDAEMMARAKLVGVYENQIRARIERAWTLPEQSPNLPGFSCRALIRQGADGRIREVELPYDGCEGSPQMRQSLISAIFAASPLPAPPHPGVFADSFSLVFRSEDVRRAAVMWR